ncbi:cell envelope integrity protein CreD [Mucilaginibacter celer]|uniref:Cell envelope integrity protein CreD n=1 Tax=Mucilaginibacter celer TaxID=2305508 RepID=A0A494VXV9_9SPHI|nr:cell envelope integrity protein CreD [Mucilaginibacter celer]AYL99209.1 cell envelope integrity protein CreD [Mucilaginibacter celer]
MITEETPKHSFLIWLKESATFKLIFIGILVLLLLIPSSLIHELITERSQRQEEVIREVSDSWSAKQVIKGPVLVIPYKKQFKLTDTTTRTTSGNIYVLPESLNIKAGLTTQILHRGIFDVAVYNTHIKVNGGFGHLNFENLGITPDQLLLNQARLEFGVGDLKGLKSDPVIKTTAGEKLSVNPDFDSELLFTNGLQAKLNLSTGLPDQLPFAYDLDLKGSEDLYFLQLGKSTTVEAEGNWANPSFEGSNLPDERKVDSSGFKAGWHLLNYNRQLPQQWIGDGSKHSNKLESNSFGVKLRLPVDQYQKTMRTSKYAVLIILLTFISLFLTEVIRKQAIHVFNYILIGTAMVIYYTLLLSFSEQVGYNAAYLIASISTIALISVFISSLLKNGKAALLFAFILTVFYTFIFVIIQLEDLALMVGSIALFMIIAILMYFSRKINWDKQ